MVAESALMSFWRWVMALRRREEGKGSMKSMFQV